VIARLGALRAELAAATAEAVSRPGLPVPGRLLRRVDFADEALGTPPEARARLAGARLAVAVAGRASRERAAGRRILRAADGGSELFREIGWKAANLAEVARLSGESAVPRWFALTHAAFAEVLNGPAVSGGTLRDRIRTILHEPGIPDAVRALRIRAAWEEVRLPGSLVAEVLGAYAELGEDAPVAVRSSAREEDSETAARAGEFDTFLCVRGRVALLRHVKWAWAGFWTDRAIRHRAVTGAEADIGGGVLVQRMVDARVSGVVQTVNTVTGNLGEIIVNAGLGLGEGVVSGSVAADRFAVEKPAGAPGDPIRYRCVAADKAEQVVPNLRAGRGTVRVPTVSHQRLRPALDYVELDEVVRTVLGLEAAYGHPLDVEFAFEGIRLRILQVRPVAALETAVRESLRRHPLGAGREPGEAAA
jgi:pyruvate,water dikinase